ncbi:hypothetical protein LWI29_008529 [Acer saccharum]|uniref:Uncharacterized protein n=1 Tax=Acer saccharum TaxID=4024 RepID=A0AA39S947_ACESA|nr:hypothetical protein LWI29_008529 [Acer saccharum]
MLFPRLSEWDISLLYSPICEDDVKSSLFNIGGLKAPGPDGLPAIFFQKFWNNCKSDLCRMVSDCFSTGSVPRDLNNTLISLIPKIPNPTSMMHFRPISLCNTSFKVLSKILVQRLRVMMPNLVSPNQVAFVPGRQIQDNIIVAQEVLHKFKMVKGKVGYIAWKIDLAKAYDKLQWGFIKHVLEEVGIVGKLNELIMSCITEVSYKVVVNGELTESFRPNCGIRQGDPLSPYIFALCMEKLSHIIIQKLVEKAWSPVKVSRGGPDISHLFFADDLILFGKATPQQAQLMRDCLDTFCDMSGQQVSFPKSSVYCSSNISSSYAKDLADLCGSPITNKLGSYLGVPLIHGRIRSDTYKVILEKTQKRLASWKSASLSFAGRCTLIKAVSSAIPVYAMQSIKLPSEISKNLDKINRNFLWGSTPEKKHVHLVSWDVVCLPKHLGGLGIKKTKLMNQALLAKIGWRLNLRDSGLWGRILKDKYLKGDHMTELDNLSPNCCSSTWRGILLGTKILRDGVKWRVGNGRGINFWYDNWVPTFNTLHSLSSSPLSDAMRLEKVSDYISDSIWNVQKLNAVLPWHVVSRILSIHVNSNTTAEDSVVWGLSNNGNFSVKSAYNNIFTGGDFVDWKWKFVWKLKLPPRVLYFLWTLLHGKLLTNCHRAARGITADTNCLRCTGSDEDVDHVFRGCPASIQIWESVHTGVTKTSDYQTVWDDWLHNNLNCNNLALGKFPNYLLFSVSLWFLWKWRCEFIFNPDFQVPSSPGQIIWRYVDDWVKANAAVDNSNARKSCLISWSPPVSEWVKLNVDGSANLELNSIAAGGVVRDHRKLWQVGFAMKIGTGSVLEAELWGILEGLNLVWQRGFRRVIVESDSKIAVDLLNNPAPTLHPLLSIIQACQSFFEYDWSCFILYVFRESNRVADRLASLGHSLDLGSTIFNSPPPLVADSLRDDFNGVGFARMVSSS